MNYTPIITTANTEPTVEAIAYECRFTVESRACIGGDCERNTGGATTEKRVTFDGYASLEILGALVDAMAKAVDA